MTTMGGRRFVYGYLCAAVFAIVVWNFSFLSATCNKALNASKYNATGLPFKGFMMTVEPETGDTITPIEEVVSFAADSSDVEDSSDLEILGDVSSVLNIAILGHAKCATTFLLKWLNSHPEVNMFPKEVCDLYDRQPAKLVRRIENELAVNSPDTSRPVLRGFKCPGHFNTHTLDYFRSSFPNTKLIVGLRHPVKYFESYYNFRHRHGKWNSTLPPPESLVGRCVSRSQGVCTDNARFHVGLAKFGRTNLTSDHELGLLQWNKRPAKVNRVPNPIFLYDVNQLYDSNATRSQQFRLDLASFLGLSTPLLPRPHEVRTDKDTALNICDEDYVRGELMTISKQASTWIRDYLMNEVTVSNADHFTKILEESWTVDPCESVQW